MSDNHILCATIRIEVNAESELVFDENNDLLLSDQLTEIENKIEALLFEEAKLKPYFSFDLISKGF